MARRMSLRALRAAEPDLAQRVDEGKLALYEAAAIAAARAERRQREAEQCPACLRHHPLRTCDSCHVPMCPVPGWDGLWTCSGSDHVWLSRGLAPPLTEADWSAYCAFVLNHSPGLGDNVAKGVLHLAEAVGIVTRQTGCHFPCDKHKPLTAAQREQFLRLAREAPR